MLSSTSFGAVPLRTIDAFLMYNREEYKFAKDATPSNVEPSTLLNLLNTLPRCYFLSVWVD